ncbi:MAG: hypothetical protein M3O36_01055 [Myxococcota bacterium]|nr:hypothetical protein [Myxococcota bacterium]
MSGPIVSRASIPEEFLDVTSNTLLVQPEPQYFHATLYKMAIANAMQLMLGNSIGVPVAGRPIVGGGAPYTGPLYDRLILATPDMNYAGYAGAIQMVPELGARVGHTVRLNRPRFGSGGFTLAAREIPTGATIATTGIDIGSEQVTLTVKRYGGPYDTVNGNVAPFPVDKLDASRMIHNTVQLTGKHLQRDLDRWVDQVLVALGNNASQTLYPAAFSSDAQSSVAGDMPLDCDTIFNVETTMKTANVPRFPNGRYMMVVPPAATRQIKNDPVFATYAKYFPSANPLFSSYIGTIGGIDLFESTSLIATANGNGIPIQSSQAFGPNFWGSGLGDDGTGNLLPRVAANTQDNYGELALLIWLLFGAFGLLDQRFGIQVHTS